MVHKFVYAKIPEESVTECLCLLQKKIPKHSMRSNASPPRTAPRVMYN